MRLMVLDILLASLYVKTFSKDLAGSSAMG